MDTIRCLLPVEREVFPVIDANGKVCGKLTISIAIDVSPIDADENGWVSQQTGTSPLKAGDEPGSVPRLPIFHPLVAGLLCKEARALR